MSFTPRNVPWAVLDRSQTAVVRRLVSEIDGSGYFLRCAGSRSYDEAHRLLQTGTITRGRW